MTKADMLALAEEEEAAWMRAYRREVKRGNSDAADACLVGANTIQQLIKKMRRATKDREAGRCSQIL